MKAIARVLIVAALVFGSSCARSDWIERTLVTVDVTGTWSGGMGGAGLASGSDVGGTFWFELEQQGSRVKGSMQFVGAMAYAASLPSTWRPIEGTVAGDVFRFRLLEYSSVESELTVSGDEMTGLAWIAGIRRPISLRRVDPSSRPPR